MRILFLLILLASGPTLTAQNIGRDVARILELAPTIRSTPDTADNPALDEAICILAYYAGMPDIGSVYELANGPTLLEHYSRNSAVREFLLGTGIAGPLERHYVDLPDTYLEPLIAQNRSRFLEKKTGSELFGDASQVNLEQIRQTVTLPRAQEFSLAAASSAAGARSLGLSPDALASSVLVGLSDFITRRAQQELTFTFLDRLREYLNANDLNYLFPETANYLPDLDLLNYKSILPSIRRAFLLDLNGLSFNLGNFLEARDANNFRDPAVYNIFLVYRILDLELREVPIPDILSFTYGELARTRSAVRSEIDLTIAAEQGDSDAYKTLEASFGAYAGAISRLNASLRAAIETTADQVETLLDELDEAEMPDAQYAAFGEELSTIYTSVTNQGMPLATYQKSAAGTAINNQIASTWLRGEEAYDYYEAYPSFTKFDEFFGPDAEPFDATKRRAAGLGAVREILGRKQLLTAYREQLDLLGEARLKLANLRQPITDPEARAQYFSAPDLRLRRELIERINGLIARSETEEPALNLLKSLALSPPPAQSLALDHLYAVEERLENWLRDNWQEEQQDFLNARLQRRFMGEFSALEQGIEEAARTYLVLSEALIDFNRIQEKGDLYRSYQNLTTFETVFGTAQQSFFLLANSGEQLFLNKEDMSIFQTDAGARQLFTGLSQERLSRVPNLGEVDPRGLVNFLLDFSLFLSNFQTDRQADKGTGLNRQRFKQRAAIEFITGTLEALLAAPILQNPVSPLALEEDPPIISFADRFAGFKKVPAINAELKELFRLSQDGEYRYAVDNLLQLFRLLDVFPAASKKKSRLEQKHAKLLEERTLELGPLADDPTYARDGFREEAVADPDMMFVTSKEVLTGAPKPVSYTARDLSRVREIDRELDLIELKLERLNPKRNQRFQENLFRYGTFMADVVAAESPTDIEVALNNVALPPGSSQIKRTRPSSIELGAYFGVSVAQERLVLPLELSDAEVEDPQTVLSLFVPVGLSYSRQFGARSSATLFASILDLGAITAFRLDRRNEDPQAASIDRLPEFSFRNVVAPGLHLIYNFPRSPFSLGFGVQDGPGVRRYTPAGSTEVREGRGVRFMLTGSVDVPIFRFGGG